MIQVYEFTINKEKVMKDVAMSTAYISTKKQDQDAAIAYERIATTDENEEMLSPLFDSALNDLNAVLHRYVIEKTVSDENDGEYSYKLGMPSNWDKDKTDIASQAHLYMTEAVLTKWLAITDTTSLELHQGLTKAHLDIIREALNYRNRPIRKY